jgi:arylformamidase
MKNKQVTRGLTTPDGVFNTRFMPALRRVFSAFLCSTIIQLAAAGADLNIPENILFETGIEYANPDSQHLQLNIARPKQSDHLLPCVLCIHGGGFRAGNRDSYNPLLLKLAGRDYVAVATSYRLAPKYQFPAAIFDVKTAVRWLKANAGVYQIDPDRIGVTGDSAGGHLAQFLGVTADVKQFEGDEGNYAQSTRVACVVNRYGPSDFTKSYGKSVDAAEVLPLWLGGNLETAREKHVLSSPLNWVTPASAPTLILHGTDDKYVAYEQGVWMRDRLKSCGVHVEMLTLEGAGHGFKGTDAERAEAAMFAFFDNQLKNSPAGGSAKVTVQRDIPYAESADPREKLDIYAPEGATNLPVVFWIHGGGWQTGDRTSVQLKPKAFVEKGFVFVSTGYRLLPNVEMIDIFRDIAKSVHWVHDHIAAYGGDPNRLLVMGHSAGAQLAALISIDDSYLNAEGLSLRIIKGCVPVDGDTYDVPAMIDTAETRRRVHGLDQAKWGHRLKFGNDPAKHRDYSAVNHVAKNKGIPPFLILHVAEHPDTGAQAERLEAVLKSAGIPAKRFAARQTDHSKLNESLGQPDDPPTQALFEFVAEVLK